MAAHARGWRACTTGVLLAAAVFLLGGPAHAILPPPTFGGGGDPPSPSSPVSGGGQGSILPVRPYVPPPAGAGSGPTFSLNGGTRSGIGSSFLSGGPPSAGGPPSGGVPPADTPPPVGKVPELDANSFACGAALVIGSLLLLTRRRAARPSRVP